MIIVICPYCKEEMNLTDKKVNYELNRLDKSLCKCDYCKNTCLVFYDDKEIKTIRVHNKKQDVCCKNCTYNCNLRLTGFETFCEKTGSITYDNKCCDLWKIKNYSTR